MNNSYLHYKKNNINLLYLLCSCALILYGVYKNGILIYKEIDSKIVLLKPLLFPIISIGISCFLSFIKNKKVDLNDNVIYALLFSLSIPVNTNIVIFLILSIIFSFILYFIIDKINLSINYICLFKIALVAILYFLHKYSYANELELINKYSYDLKDIFFGRGISGVNISSILLIIISYFVLCSNYYYKKEIPIISTLIYLLLALIFKFSIHHVIIFNSMIVFGFVFIAPISNFSPALKKEQIVYSIIVGILTFFLSYYVNKYDGVMIAILIASFMNFINIK